MTTIPSSLMNIILSLVGSRELAYKWWDSPNKAFGGETPYRTYCTNPQKVVDYICGYLDK